MITRIGTTLYLYRIIKRGKVNDAGKVVGKPKTLKADEGYFLDPTDARETLLMDNVKLIEDAGGKTEVDIVIVPFDGQR